MAIVTILTALILIALGVSAYVGSGMVSVTALIPAFIGGAFLLCGLLALSAGMRKHAMHAAAALSLICVILGATAIPAFLKEMKGDEPAAVEAAKNTDPAGHQPNKKKGAATAKVALGGVCLVFFVICLGSFLQARARRKAAEATAAV